MKIIHLADVHLGSKIESKLPKEKAEIRNNIFDKKFTVTTKCVGEVEKENNIIK